jgi:hypothetical protein
MSSFVTSTLIFAAALGFYPECAYSQGITDIDCYGGTIDIVLVKQITSELKLPLSKTLDSLPIITGYPPTAQGSNTDLSSECFKKPVSAKDVYFYPS